MKFKLYLYKSSEFTGTSIGTVNKRGVMQNIIRIGYSKNPEYECCLYDIFDHKNKDVRIVGVDDIDTP